ncbi:hypothetical protein JTE90_008967 [Oedothorax gibbosus]|uniref:Uncharacterized protein n=1 Tax=Oedothorax gibbosus TaxID=931172 RepID=A0AAV6THG5_9ARAC|nr:hypothetical protein JTE90_008967 [Oedothorax gibbosus]
MFNAFHRETFSSFTLKAPHLSICYYHQICTVAVSRRAHAGISTHAPATSSHCGVNLHGGKLCRSGRYTPPLERHPFRG